MNNSRLCSRCGAVLPDGLPEAACPQCLSKQATKTTAQGDPTCATGPTVTSAGSASATDTPIIVNQPPFALPAGAKLHYFGDYELLDPIARGGMGAVYKARQISLNRMVAIKLILAGQLADETDIKRFQIEAEAAANLQHPNIVAIHEVGEHDGQHYFSMDYIEGKNLAELLKDGPLAPAKAAELLKTISAAIHYAHQRGVVHRDLKPQNVLIDAQGQPRITDFGLAKRMDRDSSLTDTGAVMGSPSYMAPEQAAGRQDRIGPQTDVYALGAVLYQLLTGQPPFRGRTFTETMLQVMEAEPVPPSKLSPKVPPDLDTICLKCLEKRPEHRYGSAGELAEELNRFLNHESILARPASPLRKVWGWSLRHPWFITGLGALLLLLVGGFAYYLWERVAFLEWKQANPKSETASGEEVFTAGQALLIFFEFFFLQGIPLIYFLRLRSQRNPTRREATSFICLGFLQTLFGFYTGSRLVAGLVWGMNALRLVSCFLPPALTNVWFGILLIWKTIRESRLGLALEESDGTSVQAPLTFHNSRKTLTAVAVNSFATLFDLG